MRKELLMLTMLGTLLLPACTTTNVPVATQCPQIPPPPSATVKSVQTRQPLTQSSNDIRTDLTQSYQELTDSLHKELKPISTPAR